MRRTLASFWVGERLGLLELACLHSMITTGHRVTVYSYAPLANLPAGVEAGDAAAIMPTDRILYYKHATKPTAALHANLFRYAMLAQTDHVWIDLDMVLLRPLLFATDHIYGLELPHSVNNAVLRLPQDSPTLSALRQFTPTTRGLPPQIRGFKRFRRLVKTFGGKPIDEWPWGSTGPGALSHYLKQHGEWHHAQARDVFYPVLIDDHPQFLAPGQLSEMSFGPDTYGVHLWASSLRRTLAADFEGEIPAGSFLGRRVACMKAAGFVD